MSDLVERLRVYIERRRIARGLDFERIHGFDVSPSGGFELLSSDIIGAADRIEQLERVLAQARLHIAGEELPKKSEILAAMYEAMK